VSPNRLQPRAFYLTPEEPHPNQLPVLAARRPSSKHGRALAEEPSRRAQQTISPSGGVTAFAHEQPSVGVDAHDCFARRNVAELTIELATMRWSAAPSASPRAHTKLCSTYALPM
jgi:hypothetical protein